MMTMKKIHSKYLLAAILLVSTSQIQPQFILPEDNFTTQRDVDVIRVEDNKIEIRNLKVKISDVSAGEVMVAWTNIKNDVPLAVVRSDRPLSNLSALLLGKVVVLLDAGQTNFKDQILTPGDYYYAVVSYQRLKDETVILKGNENYSTVPVHFSDKDLANQVESIKETVSHIRADVLDNKSVRIQWNYDPVPNVSLLIYRYVYAIDNENTLKSAMRIGSVTAEKNYFDDQDGATGEYYYAVIVFQFGIEKMIFKADENYTTRALKKPEVASSVIKSLKALKTKKNQIIITWNDPSPKFTQEYILYRSTQQVLQESDLQNASIIKRLAQNSASYIDKDYPEGELYYAILTQNVVGSIQKSIVPGDNSLINPIITKAEVVPEKHEEKTEKIEEKKSEIIPERKAEIKKIDPDLHPEQGMFYDLQAVPERNRILISWKPEKELFEALPEKGVYYHVFRFTKKPDSMRDLTTDNYLAKVALNEDVYYDTPADNGLYYYAIFLTTPKGVLPPDLRYNDNLVGPVIYKKGLEPEKKGSLKQESVKTGNQEVDFSIFSNTVELNDEKLNNVLRRTYLQENYKEAIDALGDFRHNSSLKIRARAIFYSALSNYYLGNYKEAMTFIMNDAVKTVYADRADFWYRQILEKITK